MIALVAAACILISCGRGKSWVRGFEYLAEIGDSIQLTDASTNERYIILTSQSDLNSANGLITSKGCKLEAEYRMTNGSKYEYSCGDLTLEVREWNFLDGSGYRLRKGTGVWP